MTEKTPTAGETRRCSEEELRPPRSEGSFCLRAATRVAQSSRPNQAQSSFATPFRSRGPPREGSGRASPARPPRGYSFLVDEPSLRPVGGNGGPSHGTRAARGEAARRRAAAARMMPDEAIAAARLAAAVGCGLMAGLFFAFSVAVMRGLGRVPA